MKRILNLVIISLLISVWGCKKTEQTPDSKQQIVDSKQQIVDSRQQTVDSRQQTAGSKQQIVDSRQQTVDSRQQAADKKQKTPDKKPVYVRGETYFVLPDRKGGTIDLETYAGKPVMLMFFAQYCPFCRTAAPFVEKVYQQNKNKGLNVIGISIEDDKKLADAFANDYKLTFPVAYKGGEVAQQKYRTRGVPYIFILDKNHKIYNVWPGYDESFNSNILQSVEEVLK